MEQQVTIKATTLKKHNWWLLSNIAKRNNIKSSELMFAGWSVSELNDKAHNALTRTTKTITLTKSEWAAIIMEIDDKSIARKLVKAIKAAA